MAGDWIKMRSSLIDKPEVIRMTRILQECKAFREWLTPGGSGAMNGQIVSYEALRRVTCGLLLSVWSNARHNGVFVGEDLVLEGLTIDDLDQMAGAPGVGRAMFKVGWATKKNGVTLERFKTYNVPADAAERQAAYRARRHEESPESNGRSATKPLPEREREKREENPPKPPQGGAVVSKRQRGEQVSEDRLRAIAAEHGSKP